MIYQAYHRHSHRSNPMVVDSVVTNEDYCKRAVELGHQVISSCEHGTQGDYRECSELAAQYGLKWRYVTEAYFVKDRHEKDNTNAHIILAAKTAKGIGDLNVLLSEANLTGYYYRPRVDMELLFSLSPTDVFITTACVGGVFKYGWEDARQIILALRRHFRDSLMLEVQYHDTDKQREVNAFLLTLYRQHGIPLIMGTDSHFIYPADKALRDMRLEANNIHYADEEGWYMDYPSGEEAFERFQRQGVLSGAQIKEAISHTNIFLDFEDVAMSKEKKLPTLYPALTQEERNKVYLDLVNEEWQRHSADMTEDEKAARMAGIQYETDTITSTGTSDYFLLDHAIVKRAKELGGIITPTGRGSGVSYLTNTLLGFSSVDRFSIPVEMFPDRFISADRIRAGNLPDLDLNVANEDVFIQAQSEVMGDWRSAPMVAFGTLRRLSAWKMFCRANDVPFEMANQISDLLKAYELDLKHAEDEDTQAITLEAYVPREYLALVQQSEQYMGIIDSISPHPCAHLLCCEDIRREIGIVRLSGKGRKKKVVYAAYIDGATAERFGYLKNDLLHVDVVQVNQEVFRRIGSAQPTVNELLVLTHGDRETWRMYADGLTMGLNQVERPKTREKVMQYRPTNITELSAFVAAVRPSFQSMIQTFLSRTPFNYGIPVFDQLIQTREMPSSFIIYQEQVMKVLQYGGMTAPESYTAIKAISKKHPEKILPLRDGFLKGFAEHVLADNPSADALQTAEAAERVWRIIADAAFYLFNASHAVCVALDSLYGAFAKAHHPYEYYTSLQSLYGEKGDKDKIALVKEEMRKGFGIRVAPCRFRQDNRDFYIDRANNAISDALTSVKHISKRVADALYDMRGKAYVCFTDQLHDMEFMPQFDAANTKILIQMGYFSEFGSTGKLLKLYDAFRNGESRFSKNHVPKTQRARLEHLRVIEETIPEQDVPMADQIRFEMAHYGVPLSVYPDQRSVCAILEVDDKYSPKIRMYAVSKGNIGIMKMRKTAFISAPLQPGDIIRLYKWEKKPCYRFVGGKATVIPGKTELWIIDYVRISP